MIRKWYIYLLAVLIILSVMFEFISCDSSNDNIIPNGFTGVTVGSTGKFAGYDWVVYKNDGTYAYILTANVLDCIPFNSNAGNNKYSDSELRTKVLEYEAEMRNYSGDDMSWDEANGTADGKNYIEKHNMTETGTNAYGNSKNPGFKTMDDYDDILYVLSTDEAQEIFDSGHKDDILNARDMYWWLRTRGELSNVAIIGIFGYIWDDGKPTNPFDNVYARPALQISLESPLFKTAFSKSHRFFQRKN